MPPRLRNHDWARCRDQHRCGGEGLLVRGVWTGSRWACGYLWLQDGGRRAHLRSGHEPRQVRDRQAARRDRLHQPEGLPGQEDPGRHRRDVADRLRHRQHLRGDRAHRHHALRSRVRSPRVGQERHHRRRWRWPGDLHQALPPSDRQAVAGHCLWRLQVQVLGAEAGGAVAEGRDPPREVRHRQDEARRHQPGLREAARRHVPALRHRHAVIAPGR
mmetsp:Transcript_3374/g.8013  ORF Transcript_3374/g.8013 Transcript_3374/m.8013 type:complete len:216 (-) Transcript_3374:192-839(-)